MSGGDGMEGLAWAIVLAALCLLAVPALAGGGVGWMLGRRRGRPLVFSALGAAAGVGLGVLVVAFTFFERTAQPPSTFVFQVPQGFAHDVVVLVDDPAGQAIAWSGAALPFVARSAVVEVPASGLVRLADVRAFTGREREASLSDGRSMRGLRVLAGSEVGDWVAIVQFAGEGPGSPVIDAMDDAQLVALVRSRLDVGAP